MRAHELEHLRVQTQIFETQRQEKKGTEFQSSIFTASLHPTSLLKLSTKSRASANESAHDRTHEYQDLLSKLASVHQKVR